MAYVLTYLTDTALAGVQTTFRWKMCYKRTNLCVIPVATNKTDTALAGVLCVIPVATNIGAYSSWWPIYYWVDAVLCKRFNNMTALFVACVIRSDTSWYDAR